jgi:hypothetical protein
MAKAHQVRGSFPLYANLDDVPWVHRMNRALQRSHAAATATQQKIAAEDTGEKAKKPSITWFPLLQLSAEEPIITAVFAARVP